MNSQFKYYVIHNLNLDRKINIESELIRNGVDLSDVQFINHPNKDELTYQIKKRSVQAKSRIKDGWVSVTYKHYLALSDIVENNIQYGVIIEDNVGKFKENIPDRLLKYIDQMDEDWDIIFDSDWISYKHVNEQKVTKTNIVYKKSNQRTLDKSGKIITHGGTKSAQFYMVNLESAKKLKNAYLPFNHAPDMWMNELFRKLNINSYWAEPTFIETEKNHVSSTNFQKKFSLYRLKSKIINIVLGL
jgi:GR25 family glycosyltransferase involved in LPS biosynthesis